MKVFLKDQGKAVQVIVAIIGCSTELLCGIYTGWSSPMVSVFLSEDTPLESGPMTKDQVSLMTSALYLGAVLGSFLAGWLSNVIGRKWTLIFGMAIQLFANSCFILAKAPFLLYVSRLFNGILMGIINVILPIFIAEITEKSLRVTIGNFFGVSCNIGIFLGKPLAVLGFYVVPILSFILSIFFIACFAIFPDTPEYYLFRNRVDDAHKALRFYRRIPKDHPLPESFITEFEEIKSIADTKNNNKSKISFQDFKDKTSILAIIISFVLTSNINFAGLRIMASFTESVLEDTGTNVDFVTADFAISLMQILGSFVAIYVVRRMKVRSSFMLFYILALVGFIGAAVQFYIHELGQDMTAFTWSFLSCIALAVVVPSTGINNISMAIPSQVLPLKIRGTVLGFLNVLSFLVAFLTIQYYLFIVDTAGNSVVMGALGLWCLFAMIFTYWFVPNLENKTYSEIVEALNQRLPKKFRKLQREELSTNSP